LAAVIDQKSFDKIKGYITRAQSAADAQVLCGGECDDSQGFFIRPTIIETQNHQYESMIEEIFGPVLTVYVYKDQDFEETLRICDQSSKYALTGAIFAKERGVIQSMTEALTNSAGNFYINDKPTGAVVGQQPFGGGLKSGTNDKAGSMMNLQRWVSMRTIKETFVSPKEHGYPYQQET